MTDKKLHPICLYEDTCLHLKEKTRLCEDCVHHKNYWSELLEKEQLEKIKSLEQECEELKDKLNCCFCNPFIALNDIEKRQKCIEETECFRRKLDRLKAENEKMSKGYAELTEIVSPYIDDFTGYNEELGGFDIVLCVKELLEEFNQLKTENDKTWKTMSITFDNGTVKTEVADMSIAEYSLLKLENTKFKQTLIDIKEIAEKQCNICEALTPIDEYKDCKKCWQGVILQKISEVVE